MPLRPAAICGLAAPVTFIVGVVLADVAQPAAFSPVNDDISDLGALTASSPWLYNQVAANLTGILVLGFAFGLWAALGSGFLARWRPRSGRRGDRHVPRRALPAGLPGHRRRLRQHIVALLGAQDRVGLHGGGVLLTPLVLAFAFRRLPAWRRLWLPTLLATPAVIATSAAFSAFGPGVASRAGSAVWFLWLALVAFHLLHLGGVPEVRRAANR